MSAAAPETVAGVGGGRTGLIVALPLEARALAVRESDRVFLVLSGVGPARARAGAERAVAAGAGSLLSVGFAAGLEPTLRAGALVLAEASVGASGKILPAAGSLVDVLEDRLRSGPSANRGRIADAASLLGAPADKRSLARRTGALAADMESAAVAAVALEAGVPWTALRVISDDAATGLPGCVASAVGADGFRYRTLAAALAITLLRSPARGLRELVGLLALARDSRIAARTLADAARALGW